MRIVLLLLSALLLAACDSEYDPGTIDRPLESAPPPPPESFEEISIEGRVVKGPVAGASLTVSDATGRSFDVTSGARTRPSGYFETTANVSSQAAYPLILTASGGTAVCDAGYFGLADCIASDGSTARFGETYDLPAGFRLRGAIAAGAEATSPVSLASEFIIQLAEKRAGASVVTEEDIEVARLAATAMIEQLIGRPLPDPLDQLQLVDIVQEIRADTPPASLYIAAFSVGMLTTRPDAPDQALADFVEAMDFDESGSIVLPVERVTGLATLLGDGLFAIDIRIGQAGSSTLAELRSTITDARVAVRANKNLFADLSESNISFPVESGSVAVAARSFADDLQTALTGVKQVIGVTSPIAAAGAAGESWRRTLESMIAGTQLVSAAIANRSHPLASEFLHAAEAAEQAATEQLAATMEHYRFMASDDIRRLIEARLSFDVGPGVDADAIALSLERAIDVLFSSWDQTAAEKRHADMRELDLPPNVFGEINYFADGGVFWLLDLPTESPTTGDVSTLRLEVRWSAQQSIRVAATFLQGFRSGVGKGPNGFLEPDRWSVNLSYSPGSDGLQTHEYSAEWRQRRSEFGNTADTPLAGDYLVISGFASGDGVPPRNVWETQNIEADSSSGPTLIKLAADLASPDDIRQLVWNDDFVLTVPDEDAFSTYQLERGDVSLALDVDRTGPGLIETGALSTADGIYGELDEMGVLRLADGSHFQLPGPITPQQQPGTVVFGGRVIKGPVSGATLSVSGPSGESFSLASTTGSLGIDDFEIIIPRAASELPSPLVITSTGGTAECDLDLPDTDRDCVTAGGPVAFLESFALQPDFELSAATTGFLSDSASPNAIHLSVATDLAVTLAQRAAGSSAMTTKDLAQAEANVLGLLQLLTGLNLGGIDLSKTALPTPSTPNRTVSERPQALVILALGLAMLEQVEEDDPERDTIKESIDRFYDDLSVDDAGNLSAPTETLSRLSASLAVAFDALLLWPDSDFNSGINGTARSRRDTARTMAAYFDGMAVDDFRIPSADEASSAYRGRQTFAFLSEMMQLGQTATGAVSLTSVIKTMMYRAANTATLTSMYADAMETSVSESQASTAFASSMIDFAGPMREVQPTLAEIVASTFPGSTADQDALPGLPFEPASRAFSVLISSILNSEADVAINATGDLVDPRTDEIVGTLNKRVSERNYRWTSTIEVLDPESGDTFRMFTKDGSFGADRAFSWEDFARQSYFARLQDGIEVERWPVLLNTNFELKDDGRILAKRIRTGIGNSSSSFGGGDLSFPNPEPFEPELRTFGFADELVAGSTRLSFSAGTDFSRNPIRLRLEVPETTRRIDGELASRTDGYQLSLMTPFGLLIAEKTSTGIEGRIYAGTSAEAPLAATVDQNGVVTYLDGSTDVLPGPLL